MLTTCVQRWIDMVVVRHIAVQVEFVVFRARHAHKVLQAVVRRVAVDVMNRRSARDGAKGLFPNHSVFGLVFPLPNADSQIAVLRGAPALPGIIPFALRLQAHVMTTDKLSRVPSVEAANRIGGFSDGRLLTAATFTGAAGRFPALRRLGSSLGLHLSELTGAIPVAVDEGLSFSWVLAGWDRQLFFTSAGTSFHGVQSTKIA